MSRISVKDLNDLFGGTVFKLDPSTSFAGIKAASGDVQQGDLFVPIRHGMYDGHYFIEEAIENGCIASLWRQGEPRPASISDKFPLIVVEDPETTFQKLASYYASTLPSKVILVVGDYTTQLVASILQNRLDCSVLHIDSLHYTNIYEAVVNAPNDQHEYLIMTVVEKEACILSSLVKPEVSIVTSTLPSEIVEAIIHDSNKTFIANEENDLINHDWLHAFNKQVTASINTLQYLGENEIEPISSSDLHIHVSNVFHSQVIMEDVAFDEERMHYSIGLLAHLGTASSRILMIDEGFLNSSDHKIIHEFFAKHLPREITEIYAIGEKAFWVVDALKRNASSVKATYYKTHIEAIRDLYDVLQSGALLLYKGANKEMINSIMNELS
ncbi:hypothetical protein FLK61_33075 [Paenalkalicoccus suaedae]|uniref:UDP-N-acetylmuramoyl-tripeptide--D-alanyl-D-alanine ligase n=1 Tax=Paenalkalicoccus suaedae TaxID=2592382 RepID=A0A859FH39_9BACI|nr:hypothetical protein [Paenalkalicoccus suaedae]QKS71525.1 hypothetical protein FLK61_33075 [Paenalkalicoccus suaedae]